MDRTYVGDRSTVAPPAVEPEAVEFVRFCHRRRRVGWPELYDEMCAVAGRGLYRGYGAEELASIGIGFGLFQMPGLASIVAGVVAEDLDRRRRSAEALRSSLAAEANGDAQPETLECEEVSATTSRAHEAQVNGAGAPDLGGLRIALAAAGA